MCQAHLNIYISGVQYTIDDVMWPLCCIYYSKLPADYYGSFVIMCVCSYLVTFSPLPDNSKDEPQAVIIWDVRTGYRKRSFHCENASAWPIFKYFELLSSCYFQCVVIMIIWPEIRAGSICRNYCRYIADNDIIGCASLSALQISFFIYCYCIDGNWNVSNFRYIIIIFLTSLHLY